MLMPCVDVLVVVVVVVIVCVPVCADTSYAELVIVSRIIERGVYPDKYYLSSSIKIEKGKRIVDINSRRTHLVHASCAVRQTWNSFRFISA